AKRLALRSSRRRSVRDRDAHFRRRRRRVGADSGRKQHHAVRRQPRACSRRRLSSSSKIKTSVFSKRRFLFHDTFGLANGFSADFFLSAASLSFWPKWSEE